MSNHSLAQRVGLWVSRARNAGSVLWRWEARLRGVSLGRSVGFAGRPILGLSEHSRMVIGDGVQINSAVRSNPMGCFQPCVLRTLAPGAVLELGAGVGLSGTVIVAGKEIVVGEGTIFGAGAMVFDTDFHFSEGEWGWGYDCARGAKAIRIGRGCFIGARALVLKGVTLGDRAVVGAGAVVTQDVPTGAVAVGNPARILPPRAPGGSAVQG